MTKPPLGKVEALLYVLQHVTTKRMCHNYDTPSTFLYTLQTIMPPDKRWNMIVVEDPNKAGGLVGVFDLMSPLIVRWGRHGLWDQ